MGSTNASDSPSQTFPVGQTIKQYQINKVVFLHSFGSIPACGPFVVRSAIHQFHWIHSSVCQLKTFIGSVVDLHQSVRPLVQSAVSWFLLWSISWSVIQWVSLPVCLSVSESVSPYMSPSVSQSVSQLISQSVSQSASLSVPLSVSQSVSLSFNLPVCHSVSQSASQSVSPFVRPPVRPPVRASVTVSQSLYACLTHSDRYKVFFQVHRIICSYMSWWKAFGKTDDRTSKTEICYMANLSKMKRRILISSPERSLFTIRTDEAVIC